MSGQVEVAKEDTKIDQISAKLFAGEFNGIPVVNGTDSVIGIVTAIDVLKAIREGKSLNAMTAKDIMTPNPSVIKKDTPMNDIIDVMIKKDIVMVPVVEDIQTRLSVLCQGWTS